MTEDKTKVRDLANELGVPARNLMQVLRELDIPAKNSTSSIAAEDIERVKKHMKENPAGDQSDRREVQPGVIVRRRRQSEDDEAPRAERRTHEEAAPVTEQAPEAPAAEAPAAAPAAEAPAQKTQEAPREAAAHAAAEPEKPRQPREPRENRPKKRSGLREAAPVAKVISRPQDIAAAKAAEEAARIAAEEAAKAAARKKAEEEAAARTTAEEAKAAQKRDEEKPREEKPRKVQPAASARPEGSSAPSLLPPVSETPRAPISEGEEEEDRRDRRRPRRQEAPAPQVRIISRPDPAAAARAQQAAATAGRDGRDGRDFNRDRDNRDGRDFNRDRGDNRDGRSDDRDRSSRPAGQRPGGPRPGGFQGQRPSPAGGFGAAPGTPPLGEGQSKKKRNTKSRRGGDFQDNEAGNRRRDEDMDEMPRRGARRRPKNAAKPAPQTTQPLKAAKRKIRVEEAIRVADMAHQMGLKSNEIIKVLFNLGIMATINKALDIDTASVVAAEFGYEVEKVGFAEEEYLAEHHPDTPEQLKRRPPVVTIMGHVDHGKTSLLDAIRKTHVTSGEAGGITQHIGAYHVKTKRGEIVFLDTPGHEAFTAMRARGAQVTDLVVLVVAADDGVMEQTREAINHSRAAGVPIMVAVNKIDKPTANPDRVLKELSGLGLVPEEWGGDTVVCKVSAKTHEGLDEMLEMLALQADILELKANPDKPARGHIVEAKLDKGRGPVATVLIQEGTLHQGDTFVCGVFSGRVRAMFNDQGRKVKEAGPSIPVEVQGFEGVPEAGEEFICLEDEKLARRIAESRAVKLRERELAKQSRVTLETFLSRKADDQEALVLNLVIKSDVQGSLEAIVDALNKQSTDKVRINIIHGGTGAITESDILLASASDAIIIGFNVRPTAKVKEMAEHESVDIRFYDIIYKLVDEIKSAMAGLLAPVSREVYLGQAEVRQTFSVPKVGIIAGCQVIDGKITRNAGIRILRDGVVVHNGKVSSLRRVKDDVREVQKGYECGIGLENFNDIKIGDVIEAFEIVEEAATL